LRTAPPTASGSAAIDKRVELTYRGLILGGLITLVFTAANVYLGLKVGLTFASSIPAAVISMALLRAVRSSTIYENNIVQTVASAAGTLSSVIFVLPGLIMIGYWTNFPFWPTFGVCAIGGVLGVMYTIPLRRAMVTTSDLPYPEGVAAAEVLKVGEASRESVTGQAAQENHAGLVAVVGGTIASAVFALIVAMRVFAGEIAQFFRVGIGATGIGTSFSLALVGAGHLIGLSVGFAMLAGLVIAWGIATPILTTMYPDATASAADFANGIWVHKVRFIGAGTIGISAIWALGKLARPVIAGVASAIAASRHSMTPGAGELPRTERDIPIGYVALISVACLVPLAALLSVFLAGGALASLTVPLVLGAIVYVVIAGFLVAAACGYMAGLIGSSNSPVSGLAILTVLGASLLLLAMARGLGPNAGPTLVAFALFVTAVVLCVATIANDNLQDLKTGQLVDATPWRQQVGLIVGVMFGAAVIPPILDLINHSYGFTGGPPAAVAGGHPLAAPQATLISALAKGVLQGNIDWGLLGIGALVGIAIIALDEILGFARKMRLPPLAVGLGIYLPAGTIIPVIIGAVAGWWYNRWAATTRQPETVKRLGVLLASGLIVGESLFGVFLAGIIWLTGNSNALSIVGDAFAANAAVWIGLFAFIVVVPFVYLWTARLSKRFE
jgi:putative OPT family oligopeptide transporter